MEYLNSGVYNYARVYGVKFVRETLWCDPPYLNVNHYAWRCSQCRKRFITYGLEGLVHECCAVQQAAVTMCKCGHDQRHHAEISGCWVSCCECRAYRAKYTEAEYSLWSASKDHDLDAGRYSTMSHIKPCTTPLGQPLRSWLNVRKGGTVLFAQHGNFPRNRYHGMWSARICISAHRPDWLIEYKEGALHISGC